jgi:hypothetical protein
MEHEGAMHSDSHLRRTMLGMMDRNSVQFMKKAANRLFQR